MSLRARALFSAVLLALAPNISADSPRLTGSTPVGVQRGKATDVTIQGSGLKDSPRLFAPFPFRIEATAGAGSEDAKWKVTLLVDRGVAAGVYPIRVVTDSGVSNPILFAVGQLTQVSEVEPN